MLVMAPVIVRPCWRSVASRSGRFTAFPAGADCAPEMVKGQEMTLDPKDARAEERFKKTLPKRGYWSARRVAVALLVVGAVVIAGLLAFY